MISNESNQIDPGAAPRTVGLWCLCVVVFSILYALTSQQGASWQDSGTFQWRVMNGDYVGNRGLALAHPLYVAAGQLLKYVPAGSLPGRLNFFSGLGMAVALANLAGLLAFLTRRRWIGLLIAAMLSVTHTVWWLSTIAEVYTWSVAGLTAELWLLAILVNRPSGRTLCALALVSGLGLSVHNFALLPLPVYFILAVVLIVRKRLSPAAMAGAVAPWLVGAGLYLGFVIRAAAVSGDIPGAIRSALFGRYAAQVLNASSVSHNFKANMALSAMNFMSVLAPLAIIGWVGFRRRLGGALATALGAVTIIEVLFFVRYPVPDQFTFILPTLMTVAIAAGVGLSVLAEMSRKMRVSAVALTIASIAAQPVFYAAAPSVLHAAGVRISRSRKLPFRDEMRYWLIPWKQNEDSAQRFATEALSFVRPGDVILGDSTSIYPLIVVKASGAEPADVRVLEHDDLPSRYDDDPQACRRSLAGRALYVVHPTQDGLSQKLIDDTEAIPCPTNSPILYLLLWRGPLDGGAD